MAKKSVFLVGDSHTACLIHALNQPKVADNLKNRYSGRIAGNGHIVRSFSLDLANGTTIVNPAISHHFKPNAQLALTFWKDNRVVLVFGAHEHNWFALRVHGKEFAFLAEECDRSPSLGQFVPRALVEAQFEQNLISFDKGLALISELSGGEFYVLQGPPPSPDNAEIDRWYRAGAHVAKDAPKFVADEAFRVAVYAAATSVIRRITVKHGGQFIPAPSVAFANGMLRPEYAADPLHANSGYGLLSLQQIDDYIK